MAGPQLTNLAFGEGELIAKLAAEFLGNEVGNHQFVMRFFETPAALLCRSSAW